MRFKLNVLGTIARRVRVELCDRARSSSHNVNQFGCVQGSDAQSESSGASDLRRRARSALDRSIAKYDPPAVEEADPETLYRLERAMRSMPRLTREIFMAHRIDHRDYAHIAKVTGLSVRRVERQMAKAIHHLCRYMDGDERTAWQRWRQRYIDRLFR